MKMPCSKIAGHFLLVLILDFVKALVTVKSSAPSQKNQALQEITIPAGSFVFEFEIFVYIPDHIRYQLSSAQGMRLHRRSANYCEIYPRVLDSGIFGFREWGIIGWVLFYCLFFQFHTFDWKYN